MRNVRLVTAIVVVAALAVGLVAVSAVLATEQEVSLDKLPPAVKAAILQQAGQGKIVEIEMETENGQVVYEAEVLIDGKETEFAVSPTGRVLGADADDEGENAEDDGDDENEATVAWDSLPQPVQEALAKAAPGARPAEISQENEHGAVLYEAVYKSNGSQVEFEVTDDGHVIESTEVLDGSSLPEAVQSALNSKFPGAVIQEAESVQLSFYEVKVKTNGKSKEVRLFANGSLMEED